MPQPTRQYLFTEQQIRAAFVLSGIGMVSVIVGLLLLATSRPQGRFDPADNTEFVATLAAASEDLDGFEIVGENRAIIDIDRAMELVAERGVDLELRAIGGEAPPDGAATEGDGEPLGQTELPDGAAVYASCSGCHQGNGAGIPGAFPPLAGHAADLFNADGTLSGRDYLVQVLLLGLQGEIEVDGASYNGLMPGWAQLADPQIAAVLNHILSAWGNDALIEDFVPYTAEEIAAGREVDLGGVDLLEIRDSLSLP